MHIYVFFFWRNYSLWFLVRLAIRFHASLSVAILRQFWIFIFPRSSPMLYSHLLLCPPVHSYCNFSPFCYSFSPSILCPSWQQNAYLLILTFCCRCISVYLSQYLTNLMQKICFTVSFISWRYMFRAHVLIIRRSKLHYTASGIITPVGGRLVHETATYRCDDTRGCVMQFWPPDDKHMCSKHVETWNKTYCKTNFVHQVG